jgi:hypothetical protein
MTPDHFNRASLNHLKCALALTGQVGHFVSHVRPNPRRDYSPIDSSAEFLRSTFAEILSSTWN